MKHNYLKSLFLMLMMCVGMSAWGEEVSHVMKSYDSTNKVYTATDDQEGVWTLSTNCTTSNQLPADWSQTGANSRGICFGTPKDVTVTSKSSFSNVTKIIVEASSNTGLGTGTIEVKVGGSTLGSKTITKANHATYEFISQTPLSGVITLVANQSDKSVWIGGFKVTTGDGGDSGEGGDETTDPKVYSSLSDLVAAGAPSTDGEDVTVTLNNEEITRFYTSGEYRNGVYVQVGEREIELYCRNVPEEWVVGGKVSGTITCPWKLYNNTWELCPDNWDGLTYTAPEGGETDPGQGGEDPGEETGPVVYIQKSLSEINSSDVVIITMTHSDGSTYAISNGNGTTSAPDAVSVEVKDDRITTDSKDILWNIDYTSENGLIIYPNGDKTKWLYCTNTNNGVRVGTNTNKTFTVDGDYLKHTGTSRFVGVYDKQDFRCYTSKGGNIANQTLTFYVKTSGENTDPDPTPEKGTLTFKATTDNVHYWATFSSDRAIKFDEAFINDDESCAAAIKAYAVSVIDNELVLTDQYKVNNDGNYTYVPANTGILFKYTLEEGNFDGVVPFEYADAVGEYLNPVNDNLLQPASTKMTAADTKFYKLSKKDGKLGFFYGAADGAAFTMTNSNGAYLAVPNSAEVKAFTFDDIETAIQNVEMNKYDTKIFNLQGQRVDKAQKGIFIMNGKKVVR